jgi:hypothetical protein
MAIANTETVAITAAPHTRLMTQYIGRPVQARMVFCDRGEIEIAGIPTADSIWVLPAYIKEVSDNCLNSKPSVPHPPTVADTAPPALAQAALTQHVALVRYE